jgi:DNA-directed RNA polymerase specialized sigma24 family protein
MSRAAFLSQRELDALLAWLAPSRDQAGEKYEAIRRTLLKFFESRQCGAAEEHVDQTIDRVARRVAGGELIRSEPYRYFRGVAKKIALEYFKRRARVFDLHLLTRDALQYPHERLRCLDDCLRALPAQTRELLEGYYLGNRAALAATLGITPNALRLRVFKEKRRLRADIARSLGDETVFAERGGNIQPEIATKGRSVRSALLMA